MKSAALFLFGLSTGVLLSYLVLSRYTFISAGTTAYLYRCDRLTGTVCMTQTVRGPADPRWITISEIPW